MSDLIVKHFDEDGEGFELKKTNGGARFVIETGQRFDTEIECSYSDLVQIKDCINQFLHERAIQQIPPQTI